MAVWTEGLRQYGLTELRQCELWTEDEVAVWTKGLRQCGLRELRQCGLRELR